MVFAEYAEQQQQQMQERLRVTTIPWQWEIVVVSAAAAAAPACPGGRGCFPSILSDGVDAREDELEQAVHGKGRR